MDSDDFLSSFMNVDILKAEGAAEVVGRVVAKLHNGMVANGMNPFAATHLISESFGVIIDQISKLGGMPQ